MSWVAAGPGPIASARMTAATRTPEPECDPATDGSLELHLRGQRRSEFGMLVVQEILAGYPQFDAGIRQPPGTQRQLRVAGDGRVGQRADGAKQRIDFNMARQVDRRAHVKLVGRVVGFGNAKTELPAARCAIDRGV